MDKLDLEMLIVNLKTSNLTEASKNSLRKLSDEVKNKTMIAVSSNNPITKNAILLVNMEIIGSLINNHISMLDEVQKFGLDLTGIISDIKKEDENDGCKFN